MKQEFTPPLFKAKRTDGNGWVEGCLVNNLWTYSENSVFEKGTIVCEIITGKYNGDCWEDISTDEDCIIAINPSTLCMDSGLTAEWVADGIDKKIWSGDLFEAETRWRTVQTWKAIYKDAAFYVQRTDDEEIEVLLYDFLSDNVYTKIGSIHENEGK